MSDETTSPSAAPKASAKSRVGVWLAAIILLFIGAWYGYQRWQFDKSHVYTDNAQVQGNIVKILSPETGYVENLTVRNNQPVKHKDLLVKLSDDFYRWDVQRAQAQFNILQSRLGSEQQSGLSQAQQATAQARLEVIQSQLAEAKATAQQANSAYQRMQLQFNNDNINQSQLDMAKATKDQADASLLTLEKEAYAAEQELVEAQANGKLVGFGLDSAKAELAQAQQRLGYTSITSPINGVVAKLEVEQGVLVEPGQYLMSVVSLQDVWIVANIKESDFLKVKSGASVTITVDAFPGQTFMGVVNSTSPATGGMFALIPKDNASGNFIKVPALIPVRIDFVGLPQVDFHLLPGMSAEVSIEVLNAATTPAIEEAKAIESSTPVTAPAKGTSTTADVEKATTPSAESTSSKGVTPGVSEATTKADS